MSKSMEVRTGTDPKIPPDTIHITLRKGTILSLLPPEANLGARELATVRIAMTSTIM
jgi:hypothetical protein